MSFKVNALAAVFAAALTVVGHLVNTNVPDPYMDEIFHIPQVQKYCEKNFTHWDPKITTLPGLYLFSVGIIQPLNSIPSLLLGEQVDVNQTCSTLHLRSLNLFFGLVNLFLLSFITAQLHGEKQGYNGALAMLSCINISLLPVLFMFNFLYYTDTLSTSMVLLTYSLHLADKNMLASLSGGLAVLCRQTNIVWVFFTAALTAGDTLVTELRHHQAKTKHPPTIALTTGGQIKELIQGVLDLFQAPWRGARLVGLIVARCSGYIVVAILFLAFIRWNQGIVVGDRSAHQAVVHLPQFFYFLAFSAAFTWPFNVLPAIQATASSQVYPLVEFLQWVKNNLMCVVTLIVLFAAIVHWNTMAHPYLLADNRHLTFYLWRRLLDRHPFVKYALVPIYLFCGWTLANQIIGKASLMFKLMFPVCAMLCLVPQQLLEFRYFILPFILARLQVKPVCGKKLCLELVTNLAINAAVFALFLLKPFVWEHEPQQLQRFMW